MKINFLLLVCVFSCLNIHAFNPFVFKSVNPKKLRKTIKDELNKSMKYNSWYLTKKIIHEKLNDINIYGEDYDQNIEHVFPQCLFRDHVMKREMKSDMHNLFLCSLTINSYRNNFKYIDSSELQFVNDTVINSFIAIDHIGKKITNFHSYIHNHDRVMLVSRKYKLFIPSKYSRGKIARALSYFTIKYNMLDELQEVINLDTLIQWNLQYRVDKEEYLKNIIINQYQNISNPFIIYPELMVYCFSDIIDNNHVDSFLDHKNTVHAIDYLINEVKENDHEIRLLSNLLTKTLKTRISSS